jgi:hypothetical protein
MHQTEYPRERERKIEQASQISSRINDQTTPCSDLGSSSSS